MPTASTKSQTCQIWSKSQSCNTPSSNQRSTGSGFQDSNPAGFSTFWTNRIGSGLRFYSSFRIRFRIFKYHCFGTWRQHNHKNIFAKI